MVKPAVIALTLVAGCTHETPLGKDTLLVQNLPCLFACVSTITAADTDTAGAATVSQSTATGKTP